MATTYGKLAEIILTTYYKSVKNDNSNYSLRHIAELIAQEVAFNAKIDAYEQSKLGESTFANDQFITTYFGLEMETDGGGNTYVEMPATPAGLPQGREIAYAGFTGNKRSQIILMRNKDLFMQQFTATPKWMILAYVENGRLVFYNKPSIITGTVDLKLVGSIPTGELVNQVLNVPKSTEGIIMDKILARLNSVRGVLVDNVNDNVSK